FGIGFWSRFGLLPKAERLRDSFGMEFAEEVDEFGVLQLSRVLLPVDEPVLSEESGHGRFAEDVEVGPLHPPVGPTVSGGNNLMDFLLIFFGFRGHGTIINIAFKPRTSTSIDVDRNKIVSAPVVGRFGAGGQTGVGIPRAGHLGLNAFIFFVKDAIALLGDGQGQVLLPEAVGHGPRIAPPVARVYEDFDCHQLSLLTTFLAPLYNPTDASP